LKALTLFLLMIVFIMPACNSAAADLTTPTVQSPPPDEPPSSETSTVTPQATPEPVEPPVEPTLPPNEATNLAGTQWTLASMGRPGSETPVVAGSAVTLQFEADGQAGGSGGCNSYGGQYEVQDNTISFSQVMSTLMACADESVNQQEQQYFQALQTAGRFEVAGNQLTIWFNSDQGVLNFVKATP
jgi:heat shock protein HslJ